MFKFKGISSDEMKVICEEEDNFLAKASQRYEQTEIEGRDSAIFDTFGYSCIDRSIKLYVKDVSKLDSILSWLNGKGYLEYNGRICMTHFYSPIEPQRLSYIKTIECNFIREPFWYKKNDTYITVTNSIINEGSITSKPIIRLEKGTASSVDISINDVRFTYSFSDENFVEIDCENMNAESNGILKNRNLSIGYEFPTLEPGSNSIVVHSGDATIKVKRKDCWV